MGRSVIVLVAVLVAAACGGEDGGSPSPPSGSGAPGVVGGVATTGGPEVPLEDVIFDTFDGGSLPLSEATPADIERLLDAIPPIDEPRYQPAADAGWLSDDDLVLGYEGDDGSTWAYPHRVLDLHELVTDHIADVPVLVTYCPLCRSGVVFDRRVDGPGHQGELTFGNTSALYQNDLVMIDRQTESYWWQLAGRGIVGPLAGVELEALPSRTARWANWREENPGTMVLADDQGFGRDYGPDRFAGYEQSVDAGRTPFPVDPQLFEDGRLSPGTLVVGFEVDGAAVAVPADRLGDPVVVERAGRRFEVRSTGSASVVELTTEGAVPYPSRSLFWFAYLAAFPGAEVVDPDGG